MKSIHTTLLIFLYISCFSQQKNGLTLVYNLFDNTVEYFRNGELVSTPSLKDGENIYVEIKEFNPYIFKASLKTEHDYSEYSDVLTAGNKSLDGGGLGGISQLLGGLSLGTDLQSAVLPSSRGQASKQTIAIKNKYYDIADQLVEAEEKINASYEQIKLIEYQERAQHLAVYDIYELKHNSHIKPSRIKELIEEEIRYAFAKKELSTLHMEDLLTDLSQAEKRTQALEDYKIAIANYKNVSKRWNSLALEIERLDKSDKLSLLPLSENITRVQEETEANIRRVDQNEVKSNNLSATKLPKLVDMRRTYEEIQSGIFTYRFPPKQASGNALNLQLEVEKKGETGEYSHYKSLEQIVPVSGQWKISGGLGIAFSKLANETFAYSVVDDEIVAGPLDDFVPMIASFVHAYRRSQSQINLGASFGLGFPLESGEGIRSLSFFLGPTLILGKNEKFLVSGGFMGAKARRLGSGFSVGDSFEGIAGTLPLNDKYELGYFISISYDLIK